MTKSIPKADFEKSDDLSASQTPNQILKFERADWTSFRTIEGLQQKAGVSADKLRRLVLKELADNGLDTGASVNVGNSEPSRTRWWFPNANLSELVCHFNPASFGREPGQGHVNARLWAHAPI
jgi:hypothetical protein